MPILLTICFILSAPDSVALKPVYPAPTLEKIEFFIDSSYKAGGLNEYEYCREKAHQRRPVKLYEQTLYESPFNKRDQA